MYQKYIPFKFYILKDIKEFELSDQVKELFSDIINRIVKDSKKKLSEKQKEKRKQKLCQYIKEAYQDVSEQMVKEIRMQGNKKSIHCIQEVEFLYVCVYLLHKNYGMSQRDAGEIFGLKKNEFVKLGIYPVRNCDAYHTPCEKRMFPKDWDGEIGQKIAKLINQKILACYSCQGVYVIAHRADVFVNLYHPCQQAWYFMIPEPKEDDDLAYLVKNIGIYLFNHGNTIEDKDGKRVGYGRIKEKILQILTMQDKTMSSDFLEELLLADDIELSEFVLDGEIASFQRMREQYQFAYETVQIGEKALADGTCDGIEYEDRHFGAMPEIDTIKKYQRWIRSHPVKESSKKTRQSSEEIVIDCMEKANKKMERLRPQLIENLNGEKLLAKKENIKYYQMWIRTIHQMGKKKTTFSPTIEEITALAAWFYIIEAFPLETIEDNITQEKVQELKEFVESSQLAEYVDAIEREKETEEKVKEKQVKEKQNKEIEEEVVSNTFIPRKGELLSVISKLPIIKRNKEKGMLYSLMVYIDIEDYDLQQSEVDEMLNTYKVALVVRGKRFHGIKLWNKKLNLYTNVEEL